MGPSNAAPYVLHWSSGLVRWRVVVNRWLIVLCTYLLGGQRSIPRWVGASRVLGCTNGGVRCRMRAQCLCSWRGTRSSMMIDIDRVRIGMWSGLDARPGPPRMIWYAECARRLPGCSGNASRVRGPMPGCTIVRSWLMYLRMMPVRGSGQSNRLCVARVCAQSLLMVVDLICPPRADCSWPPLTHAFCLCAAQSIVLVHAAVCWRHVQRVGWWSVLRSLVLRLLSECHGYKRHELAFLIRLLRAFRLNRHGE